MLTLKKNINFAGRFLKTTANQLLLFAIIVVCVTTTNMVSCNSTEAYATIAVQDSNGNPIAERNVFYTESAKKYGIEYDATCSEEQIISDGWQVEQTNSFGIAKITLQLWTNTSDFYFMVLDREIGKYTKQSVTIHSGKNKDIIFKINE